LTLSDVNTIVDDNGLRTPATNIKHV